MKSTWKVFSVILCLCMVCSAYGCTQGTAGQTAAPTTAATEPAINGAEVYADAIADIENAQKLSLQVNATETIAVGTETFRNSYSQTINYTYPSAGNLVASISEKATYGDYTTHIDEIYIAGNAYVTVADCNYVSEMTPEEFSSRHIPALLLDPAHYSTVSVDEDMSVITFTDATALESWMADENAQLISATGIANLDAHGVLVSSTYEASYHSGSAVITQKVTVRICPPDETPIEAPRDADSYTKLTYLDAPRVIERAYGYLTTSNHVTSTASSSYISQATGVVRSQQISIDTYGTGDDHMVAMEQNISQINYSVGSEAAEENLKETFRDGKYSSIHNGGEPEENPEITADVMRTYYQNLLTSNLLNAGYLSDATCTDLGGLSLIEFTCIDQLGDALGAEVCYTLFQNADFLNELASAYETAAVDVYLAVDNATGLPTALGYYYEGYHTISNVEYMLSLQVDQSFDLASMSSYEAITDETLPDTEPEEKATPLFYHVTGSDGQEMWLLGTIHIGDDRTAYLPQEIMDAFGNADALAVEFNTEAFNDQLENDKSLLTTLSEVYYYTDTATADHIADEALYETAQKLMKASGNYNYNSEYLKVSVWANFLENYYLQMGYDLAPSKGVDIRLLKLAAAQDKKILEVEDGISQTQMLSGWSDALQERLLESTVSTGAREYYTESEDLYALWCSGDEAALTEMLNEEVPADATAEELALYEEYTQKMSTDRNAHMLEVAKTYLESGETVFYAVGLAHLLVEDGLVNTLRDAGYTVELVSYE